MYLAALFPESQLTAPDSSGSRPLACYLTACQFVSRYVSLRFGRDPIRGPAAVCFYRVGPYFGVRVYNRKCTFLPHCVPAFVCSKRERGKVATRVLLVLVVAAKPWSQVPILVVPARSCRSFPQPGTLPLAVTSHRVWKPLSPHCANGSHPSSSSCSSFKFSSRLGSIG